MWKGFKRKNTDKVVQQLKKSFEDWDVSPDFSSWEKLSSKLDEEISEDKINEAFFGLDEEYDLDEIKQGYSDWEPEFDEQKIWEDVNDSITFEKIWKDVSESLNDPGESKTVRPLLVACTLFFVLISFFVNESALYKQNLPGLKAAVNAEKTGSAPAVEESTADHPVPNNTTSNVLPRKQLTANNPVAGENLAEPEQIIREQEVLAAGEQAESSENIAYLKLLPLDISQAHTGILQSDWEPARQLQSRIGFFVSSDLISINQRDNINELGTGVTAGLYYSNFKNRIPFSLDVAFSVSSNRFSSYYNGEFTNGKLSMTSLYFGLNLHKTITRKINVLGGVNLSKVNNLMQERNGVLIDVNAHNPVLLGFNAGIEKKIIGNLKTRVSYNAAFPLQKSSMMLTMHEFRLGLLF